MCCCGEGGKIWRRREKEVGMITIRKSETADTRTCDVTKVTREKLYKSSVQHIEDVELGIRFFADMLEAAGRKHDADKLTAIDQFHADFATGFKEHSWWDRHRKINRHHLNVSDGVPSDVNLVDVIEHIVDCVMAGMGRSGIVNPLALPAEILERAFQNTVEMLKREVVVEGGEA